VVDDEKFAGGRGAKPAPADGPTAEEGFGIQTDEDLPDGDLIGEAGVERGHGRRLAGQDEDEVRRCV
jgi:hypothetical protein